MAVPRVSDAAASVASIAPGSTVAVGGMHMTAAPMTLVRELIRQQIPVGRLVTSPSTSLQADLLIGAGLVEELLSPYVGFEHLGLAPCFRRAAEGGTLRVLECDEGTIAHALYAGAGGLPFIPCAPGVERSDIPAANRSFYRWVQDPFDGSNRLCAPALRPDVALLHGAEADEAGNVLLAGFPFTDRLMALAAHRLVVQVERRVPALDPQPAGTVLPGFLVEAAVEAPGGCHPTAAPGHYDADEEAITAYLREARTPEGFAAYVEREVRREADRAPSGNPS
jgi:glutaconate CoA-transferase, subunit A